MDGPSTHLESKIRNVDAGHLANRMEGFQSGNLLTGKSWSLAFAELSYDIGRCDLPHSIISLVSVVLMCLFLILSSTGYLIPDLAKETIDPIAVYVYGALEVFATFGTCWLDFVSQAIVFTQILVLLAALNGLTFHLIRCYKADKYPSTTLMTIWLVLMRLLPQCFTFFTAFLVSEGVLEVIFSEDMTVGIAMLGFGIPCGLLQANLIVMGGLIYGSTPILRKNDVAVVWHGYSFFEMMLHGVIAGQSIVQRLVSHLFDHVMSAIVHLAVNTVVCIAMIVFIMTVFPYARMPMNTRISAVFMLMGLIGVCPLLGQTTDYLGYALIVIIVVFILGFVLFTHIMKMRVERVLGKFFKTEEEKREGLEDGGASDMSLLYDMTVNADEMGVSDIGLTSVIQVDLAIRLGYLYNVDAAQTPRFLQTSATEFPSAQVLVSVCQVLHATQSDPTLLMTVSRNGEIAILKFMQGVVFLKLVNDIRLEGLSPQNQPLLTSLGKAKKILRVLTDNLSDFWTAALKGRPDMMLNCIPLVSTHMLEADAVFERTVRNYPTTPIVLREVASYYHGSTGDHSLCVEFQTQYHRSKRIDVDMMTTTTATLQMEDNVDKAFMNRMEPRVAAQETIMGMRSIPMNIFTLSIILAFIIFLALPASIFALSESFLKDFQVELEHIADLAELQYSFARLVQLGRRRNLVEIESSLKDVDADDEYGPPMATHNEFVNKESILPAFGEHLNKANTRLERIIAYCKEGEAVREQCESREFVRISGNAEDKVTAGELFSAMTTYGVGLLEGGVDWSNVANHESMKFLFQNFDASYDAVSKLIGVLEVYQLDTARGLETSCLYIFGAVAIVPVVLLGPLVIAGMIVASRELVMICKMFMQFPKSELSSLRRVSNAARKENATATTEGTLKGEGSETSLNQLKEAVQKLIDSLSTTKRSNNGLFSSFIYALLFSVICSIITNMAGAAILYTYSSRNIDQSQSLFIILRVALSAPATYVYMQEMFVTDPILGYTRDELIERGEVQIGAMVRNFNRFVYGEMLYDIKPSIYLGGEVDDFFVKSSPVKSDGAEKPVNGLIHKTYIGESCDGQVRILEDIVRYVMGPAATSPKYTFADDFVYHVEHLIFSHIDAFFQNGSALVEDTTLGQLEDASDFIAFVLVTGLILQMILFITLVLPSFLDMKHHLMTIRRLLLLLDPVSVLKTQSVMKWISGQSSKSGGSGVSQGQIDEQFMNFIVDNSKCGLLLSDKNMLVNYNNQFAGQMFRGQKLVGESILSVFESHLTDPQKARQIRTLDGEIQKMLNGRNQQLVYEFKSQVVNQAGTPIHLSIQLIGHPESGSDSFVATSFSVVVVDRTTEHYQEALVADEKQKGDNLVASLLPPSIVQRMSEGEQDISFEVQQATVCFTAVCGWTELIQPMTAVEVVQFLNALYSAYDNELHNFQEITKLKTIGHIYMIAAGLFNEFNCADVMLNYCLACLQHAATVAEELKLTFKTTMGVNTGGPVNCGILGHTRPVFDILGDVVNVASRMNSSCIPGYIQISEPCYSCVKFLSYQIRERGEIAVKGKGNMKTYLVSPNVS